jgi:hypothetical protein
MKFNWLIYRDCDSLRLRKVVVELYESGTLVHKTRLFYPFFAPSLFPNILRKRKKWMLKVAKQMVSAESVK